MFCNIFLVPPMMWVPVQQMNVYYGQDATLVCVVEAHPNALVFLGIQWSNCPRKSGISYENTKRSTLTQIQGIYLLLH